MTGSLDAQNRNDRRRTKVKTGCTTCRVRKVKCDERKPSCQKCVSTGRSCDGYESLFRNVTSQKTGSIHLRSIKPDAYRQPIPPGCTARDVDLLNRCFSTKTMCGVDLDCGAEAKRVLQASLTDPSVRYAISALKCFREDLETCGEAPASVWQQRSCYDYGLQQYCTALGDLALKLSNPRSNTISSALLCCQVLISIEQARGNYAVMVQHMLQGLSIMHEHQARPNLVSASELIPATCGQLPFLDVFIIKLFAAPCRFADRSTSEAITSVCPIAAQGRLIESPSLRSIAPDVRKELARIANSTLEFLEKVTQVKTVENATQLLSEKNTLLKSLEAWATELELVLMEVGYTSSELLSVSFMRLFYQVLRIVVLAALGPSPTHPVSKIYQLQEIARYIDRRVKTSQV